MCLAQGPTRSENHLVEVLYLNKVVAVFYDLCIFTTVPVVGLQSMIVVFLGYTHYFIW